MTTSGSINAPAPDGTGREADRSDHHETGVAIIGTGFSGLCLAARLLAAGHTDFLLFDRADDVGGTWRDNTYPGAASDIRANLYSLSFFPNPNWKSAYASRDELKQYLGRLAEEHNILPHVRFRHELLMARWNSSASRWDLDTSAGHYRARILVSGMGYLCEPRLPAIPGLDSFAGPAFHTARWDHDVDLTGKRVAVVGTGSSSVQVVPAIQPRVAHLDVYQRSPAWILEKHDTPNVGFRGWALKLPGMQRANRLYNEYALELLVPQLARPWGMWFIQRMANSHLVKQVHDPDLRARLTPHYTMGCKRMLFSNSWYPALQQPNVDLITDPIREITPSGMVTSDGVERPVDVLVLASGFHTTDLPFARRIRGTGDRLLADAWTDHQYAYLGATVPGFPNCFLMLGPNTTLGHSAVTLMIEAQATYIADAVDVIGRRGVASVDVRPDVVEAYNQRLQKRLRKTVWNAGGCTTWFRDASGRNTTIWPRTSQRFRRLARRFDLDDYVVEVAPIGAEPLAASAR